MAGFFIYGFGVSGEGEKTRLRRRRRDRGTRLKGGRGGGGLVVVDGDDVGRGEVEGDFVSWAWGDCCGGEGVHLGDLDWGCAFEFDDMLGGFAEVGGVEEFAWEGVG